MMAPHTPTRTTTAEPSFADAYDAGFACGRWQRLPQIASRFLATRIIAQTFGLGVADGRMARVATNTR